MAIFNSYVKLPEGTRKSRLANFWMKKLVDHPVADPRGYSSMGLKMGVLPSGKLT